MTSDVDLEALERRLREEMLGVCDEAAEALALLRQERTQLQGLIETWQHRAEMMKPFNIQASASYSTCIQGLQAVLSGSVVSPEAQDK